MVANHPKPVLVGRSDSGIYGVGTSQLREARTRMAAMARGLAVSVSATPHGVVVGEGKACP